MAPRPPLNATPTLDRLLAGLEARLRRLVIGRALGLAFCAAVGWWAWAFFADYVLAVPSAVRTFHGIVLVALPLGVLWYHGVRPLAALPDRRGLAVLLEAKQPTADLLTSAVDFQEEPAQAAEAPPVMVARVLAAAEDKARTLASQGDLGVLDPREPRRAMGAAAGLVALFALATFAFADHQRVFASRLFGAGADWPQLTFLAFEIPLESGVERAGDVTRVRLARGEDLPVTVVATGRTPDGVELVFDDGSRRGLAPAGERDGAALFTTTLRSLSRDLAFTAVGGDDERRVERVEVLALIPPDLTSLAVTVTPPAYSGLAPETFENRDVTVLEGSRIAFVAAVEPAGARGVVRLLPEDRTLELEPVAGGLAFELLAERSLRLRFELVDDEGLANPDPGLWSVAVREDTAPRLAVRSPDGLSLETTADGIVPLWVAIEDDFAVAGARLIVTPRDGGEPRELDLELSGEGRDAQGGARGHVFAPLGLAELAAAPEAGQTHWLEVEARDNREPAAGLGRSSKVAVRILSGEDYMRRVQDRLAGTRRRVSELFDLQRDRIQRTEELVDALVIDGFATFAGDELDAATRGDLDALESGARRIQADAEAIAREVAALAGDALHARIDPEASGQVAELDRLIAAQPEFAYDPALWRQLFDAHNAGRLGKAGFANNLLDLAEAGLDVAEGPADAARAAVELAVRSERTVDALEAALDAQRENLAALEALLGRLAEWDNFQSVLSLTREVLERQRALRERTKDLATQ